MLRVNAYTGGTTTPSARFRVRQYIPHLAPFGVEIRELAARFSSYPPDGGLRRLGWGAACLMERLGAAVFHRDTDLTILQREMISTVASFEGLTKAPRVLDVDDAIWLSGRRGAIESLARHCRLVICGNRFIADFFQARDCEVKILPTAVDTDRYQPSGEEGDDGIQRICWSGTSSGHRYLLGIEEALSLVLKADRRRRLRIISDKRPPFTMLPADQLEFVRWSEQVEVDAIRSASVGIMPLDESLWARGKCSYKLLTYMACGIPVVASPVGMNADVLAKGTFGFAARTTGEWEAALEFLFKHPEDASRKGLVGRQIVEREYSLRTLAPAFAGILHAVEQEAR